MIVTIKDHKTMVLLFDSGYDLVHFRLALEWVARNSDKVDGLRDEERAILDRVVQYL